MHGRPVGFGQVDVPALHQPPGDRSTPGGCTSTGCSSAIRRSTAGCYELAPREAARQRRDIGMVFQHFNLFPHLTALENIVEAPIQVKRTKKAAAVAKARDLLAQVGLSRKGATPTRRSCPAASSSGSRSPGRWPWTPS